MSGFVAEQIRTRKIRRQHHTANGIKADQSPARATPGTSKNIVLAKKLLELLNEDDLAGAVEVWREGMKATQAVWDAKSATFVESKLPDWPIRERMASQIVAYMEGRPIERQVQISGGFEDLGQLIDRISASPIAQRKLGHIIDTPTKKT